MSATAEALLLASINIPGSLEKVQQGSPEGSEVRRFSIGPSTAPGSIVFKTPTKITTEPNPRCGEIIVHEWQEVIVSADAKANTVSIQGAQTECFVPMEYSDPDTLSRALNIALTDPLHGRRIFHPSYDD